MFIGFMGVPGCGKSATAAALATELGVEAFLEPEEAEWSHLVSNRSYYGDFGPYLALQWFRNTRVPKYLEASEIHSSGGTAVVDSMYDKLIAKYISDPNMAWLISENNPYFKAALNAAEVDYLRLPNPTHLVFVYVDGETWRVLLKARSREFDAEVELTANLAMQTLMYSAAKAYCTEAGVKFILHQQQIGSALETAHDVNLLLSQLT